MPVVNPTPEQIARLAQAPDDSSVVMINLLAFKPDGGVESYERYAEGVQPLLAAVGAEMVHMGSAREVVVGEEDRAWWDAIVVVRYPSISAFIRMVYDPAYQAVRAHRTAALQRAELIATTQGALAT